MNTSISHFRAFKSSKARGGPKSRLDWGADLTLLRRLMHALEAILNNVGATDRLISAMAKFLDVSKAVMGLAAKEMNQSQAEEYRLCLECQVRFYKASILYLRQLFRL